jgi:hypothetical protein
MYKASVSPSQVQQIMPVKPLVNPDEAAETVRSI